MTSRSAQNSPTLHDRSSGFDAFVAPARGRSELWRLLLGVLLTALIWLAAVALLPLVATAAGRVDAGRMLVLAYLGSFGAMVLGLWLALWLLHGRGLESLIGPGGFRPRPYLLGAAVVALLSGIGGLVLMLSEPPARNLAPGVWIGWLPAALAAIAVQTAAEELAFRGYLMQQLAARFASRAIWLGVPAVLFGLLHWNPVEFGANAWLVVLTTVAVGLVLGDITARLGNLSAAMGLHFANNVVAILLLAMPSPLAALSLWLVPVDPGDVPAMRAMLLADLAATLGIYALWRAWWHRRARLHSQGPDSI